MTTTRSTPEDTLSGVWDEIENEEIADDTKPMLPTKTENGKTYYGLTTIQDLALLPAEMIEQAIFQLLPLTLQIKMLMAAAESDEQAQTIFDSFSGPVWFTPDADGEPQSVALNHPDGSPMVEMTMMEEGRSNA
jgi:hypothetical protein